MKQATVRQMPRLQVSDCYSISCASLMTSRLKGPGLFVSQWRLESAAALDEARARVRRAVEELQLDLDGCISSALVFQPRATLTTSECVAALLESQPAFARHGDSEAWAPVVLSALQSGPFSAIVPDPKLKDAAGKPLETSWHYAPSLDKDASRRGNLAPFVKTVRSAARQRAQYYFKPIADLKKRKW